MTAQVDRVRVRTALDRLTSRVSQARMLAVREAMRVHLRFEPKAC